LIKKDSRLAAQPAGLVRACTTLKPWLDPANPLCAIPARTAVMWPLHAFYLVFASIIAN
jgi:hypothetical protein